MLSSDLEFRRHSAEISKAFPQFSDNLVIVIDGKTADVADDAARELADYLSAHPKLFGRVIDTAGSKFFRRNGLLYLDLDDETGVKNVIGLPAKEIERLEGEDPTNPNYNSSEFPLGFALKYRAFFWVNLCWLVFPFIILANLIIHNI